MAPSERSHLDRGAMPGFVRSFALLLLGIALGAGLTWLGLRRVAIPIEDTPVPDEVARAPAEEPAELPEVERAEAAPEEGTVAVRDVLADFWGADWAEVEEEIRREAPELLERRLDPDSLPPPFEELIPEIREKFLVMEEPQIASLRRGYTGSDLWPEPVTEEFLRETFHIPDDAVLDPDGLVEAQRLAAELSPEVESTFQEFLAGLNRAREEQVLQRRARIAPFYLPQCKSGIPPEGVRAFMGDSFGYKGWSVGIVLRREDYPELDELERKLKLLAAERRKAVRRALKKL